MAIKLLHHEIKNDRNFDLSNLVSDSNIESNTIDSIKEKIFHFNKMNTSKTNQDSKMNNVCGISELVQLANFLDDNDVKIRQLQKENNVCTTQCDSKY